MKAADAQVLTKKAKDAQAKREARTLAAEAKKAEAQTKRYMREEYPAFEEEVYGSIKIAALNRLRKVDVEPPCGAAWERLEQKLRADGYFIESHFVEGSYQNMGDFNAPCNIWTEPYWYYTVSW